MALDTCLVVGYIHGQDGQPVPGGQLQSRLNKVDRDGGLVVPTRDSVVTADDEGYFEAPLWSNARGDTGSQYIFRTRYPDGGNIGQWTGTVPDEETAQFHVVIDTDPPPTLSDAQTAQNAAETAASEALGHKQDSAGSATAAAASAATAETQATASAASATASGNSEAAAGISAGEAVASATAAASSETQSAGSAAQSAASATESQGFSIDSAASATAAASEKDDAVAAKVASEAAVQGIEDFATLSQTWATGTEPAGAGTLSSREEADRAEAAKVAAEAAATQAAGEIPELRAILQLHPKYVPLYESGRRDVSIITPAHGLASDSGHIWTAAPYTDGDGVQTDPVLTYMPAVGAIPPYLEATRSSFSPSPNDPREAPASLLGDAIPRNDRLCVTRCVYYSSWTTAWRRYIYAHFVDHDNLLTVETDTYRVYLQSVVGGVLTTHADIGDTSGGDRRNHGFEDLAIQIRMTHSNYSATGRAIVIYDKGVELFRMPASQALVNMLALPGRCGFGAARDTLISTFSEERTSAV